MTGGGEVEGLVGFTRQLRKAGLDASPARTLTFCRAVATLGPPTPDSLYWAGRLALVAGPAEIAAYDRAFAAWLGPAPDDAPPPELDHYRPSAHGEGAGGPDDRDDASEQGRAGNDGSDSDGPDGSEPAEREPAEREPTEREPAEREPVAPAEPGAPPGAGGAAGPADPAGPVAVGAGADEEESSDNAGRCASVAGTADALRRRDFERLTPAEREAVAGLIRGLAPEMATRRSRRLRPAGRGRRPDPARTLRWAVRTDGEPLRRAWRAPQQVERPLVLLLDVSGSMAAYARPLLQFAFAAHASGRRVEVFCFATRLTRITPALGGRDPDAALARAAGAVADWDGGTRIAASLAELLRRHAQSSLLRGAVVVVCSDGLERDDPDRLGACAARLGRLAHRLVWVNPLKRHPGYEPLARGMAAALPHVDRFLPGHNLAALEDLARAVAG